MRHGDWCDQLRIGTDKNIILDDRLVLVGAVVVAGNRPGADIDIFSNDGIADVTEMIRFAAGGNGAIFDLDEIADMNLVGEPGSGTDAGVRSNTAVSSDFRRFPSG